MAAPQQLHCMTAAWGAVTARQEAAPDRVRHVTNSCLATTDPSVVNPVLPGGLREEPSDKLRPQLLWSELTIVKTSFTKLSEQKIFPKPFSEISKSISQSDYNSSDKTQLGHRPI